jgi:hypothetical protein
MTCQHCARTRHFCYSCGVEEWYFTFCSEHCLEAAGFIVCPSCYGWGCCTVHPLDDNDWSTCPDDCDAPRCEGFRPKPQP